MYRVSAVRGFRGTVFDLGNEAKQAISEVEALVKEIKGVLRG